MPLRGSKPGRRLATLLAVAVAAVWSASAPGATGTQLLPPSFQQIKRGPAGGTVSQGLVPNSFVRGARRLTLVYLPPNASAGTRYPVLYLLQGFRGSPYQFVDGLRLAQVANSAIAAHKLPPFIAVMPPAGLTAHYHGEWTGVWEDYLVDDVVPWVNRRLPVVRARSGRAAADTTEFAHELASLRLRHVLGRGGHNGAFWRAQLTAALRYALVTPS